MAGGTVKRRWFKKGKSDDTSGYEPLQDGDDVTWNVAMIKAISALDHAAALSIKTDSPSGMREVAIGWLAVAASISEMSQSEMEEHDLDSSDEYQIGFRGSRPELITGPEEEEEEEDYDECEGHKGHGSVSYRRL